MNELSRSVSDDTYYLVLVRDPLDKSRWIDVGRDDVESCAWDWASTVILENEEYDYTNVGVLTVIP